MKAWAKQDNGDWSGEFYGHTMSVIGMYAMDKDTPEKRVVPDCWVYRAGNSRMLYGYPDTTKAMAMKAAEQWASQNRIKREP